MTGVEWPQGLTREPWKHQHDAYTRLGRLWFAGQPGVALFSGMGTGKSLVATALFQAFGFRRILIVSGTKAMVEEWPDMLAAYTDGGIRGVPLTGTLVKRTATLREALQSPDRIAVVTNVESYWSGRLGYEIECAPWDCLVFDESQKIKGAGSKASLFAYRLAKRHPQAKRLIMTGTPLHDKPIDIYGQYRFLDPRVFGTNLAAFKTRYAVEEPIAQGIMKITGYKNLDEFADRMHAIAFRVDESVLDLPPISEIDRRVRLTGKSVAAYERLRSESILELTGTDDVLIASNVLARQTRLQQVTSGYVNRPDGEVEIIGHDKRDALLDLLSDLDPAKPVVVFGRFSYDLDTFRAVAASLDRPYLEQSGRRHEWREWRARDDNAILGVQVQAGGAGIDLTRSPYGVFYSHTFSLGDYEQAVKRIHRPGQASPTILYHLLASVPNRRSVDLSIRAALRDKREVGSYLVDEWQKETAYP
jgi:SNF2 family DNA or RNA helicase